MQPGSSSTMEDMEVDNEDNSENVVGQKEYRPSKVDKVIWKKWKEDFETGEAWKILAELGWWTETPPQDYNETFPRAEILQQLCKDAYEENNTTAPYPWKFVSELNGQKSTIFKLNGLRARVFINTMYRQLLIVFKGTKKTCMGDIKADVQAVLRVKSKNSQCSSAVTIGVLARKTLERCVGQVQLILSGHSLGGYLAQITAYAAQNLKAVNFRFEQLDYSRDLEIYPRTVVFDSPSCLERIKKTTLVNPVPDDHFRLDITNYVINPNVINARKKSLKHVGSIIVLGERTTKRTTWSYNKPSDGHGIDEYAGVEVAPKIVMLDLANWRTMPYDETFVPYFAFSKREFDWLNILPCMRGIIRFVDFQINFSVMENGLKIFNEHPDKFVPRLRRYLYEYRELLTNHVQLIQNFQLFILTETLNAHDVHINDCNITLKDELVHALLSTQNDPNDIFIQCKKTLNEKIIIARSICNSTPNSKYVVYNKFQKLSTGAKEVILRSFDGFLVLVMDSGETLLDYQHRTCKFIVLQDKTETNYVSLRMLEEANIEIFNGKSKAFLLNMEIDWYGNSVPFKDLCFLSSSFNVFELFEIKEKYFVWKEDGQEDHFYVDQQLIFLDHSKETFASSALDAVVAAFAYGSEHLKMLLTANPGMGKTTFFKQLHAVLSEVMPTYWIVKIDLLRQNSFLNTINKRKNKVLVEEDPINFLKYSQNIKNDNRLVQEILKSMVHQRKIVVIIDAFDEICPLYRSVTLKLVKKLQAYKLSYAISTRPQERDEIMTKLKLKGHYKLTGLEIKNVSIFFKGYFQKVEKMDVDVAEAKASLLATKLNEAVLSGRRSKSKTDMMEFWTIPLHARMAAEIFSAGEAFISYQRLSDLYEQLLDKRLQRDLQEKMGMDLNHPKLHAQHKNKKSSILTNLMLLAMDAKFGYPVVPRFKRGTMTEINDTGIAIVNRDATIFSHNTFTEFLCVKFCLQNKKNPDALTALNEILTKSEHWMMRKFLNEMSRSETIPRIGHYVQENAQSILIRLCKDGLVNLYNFLKRSKVEFILNCETPVTNSQEDEEWHGIDFNGGKEVQPNKIRRLDSDTYDGSSDLLARKDYLPLAVSIKYGSEEMAEELMKDGANLKHVVLTDEDYVDMLSWAVNTKMFKIAQSILRCRPLTTISINDDFPILCEAIEMESSELVRMLLKAGASLLAVNKNNKTAVELARYSKNTEIANLLKPYA